MLKRVIFALAFIGSVAASMAIAGAASARELVLAFDNCLQSSSGLDSLARSQMLVRNLATGGVPQSMFLIQTRGLGAKGRQALGLYSQTGQLLVNAGFYHNLVTKADLYAYEIGILKADRFLRRFGGYKKHIHFSYLNESGDALLQSGLKNFLRDRQFKPTYIGTNPLLGADAYLNQLYQQKLKSNRPVDMEALQNTYVELVEEMLNRQSEQAFLMLGYSPPQVLVLQENDLAAYFILALSDRLQAQGWTFAAPDAVFASPLANPVRANGFGGNDFLNAITWMPDARIAYPRVLGERKTFMDAFIQARMPGLLE